MTGRRPVATRDQSRNLTWLAPLAFGEAWHNNHHAFPTSARHGLSRWQLDPGAWLISGLERCHLAWDVIRIAPERQQTRRTATRDPSMVERSSPDEHELPISGYDGLKEKEIADQLAELSQVELAAVESYERAHESRPVVLDKLRYMRGGEPLPGYDGLTTEQIAKALDGADAETVKAVRDYERKFQHRQSVLDETGRVLPDSPASPGEERAHEEKAALLREGYADRERTAPDPPG